MEEEEEEEKTSNPDFKLKQNPKLFQKFFRFFIDTYTWWVIMYKLQ